MRCDPEAIHEAVSFLEKNGINLDEEIVKAVRNIQISKWFYLRDTTKYSIFIDEKSENAYAVHGLTDPIKEVTSGASTFFEAGLFQLNGKYVCDGLASSLVYFGPGIRSSLNESLKAIKQQKRFHKNAL